MTVTKLADVYSRRRQIEATVSILSLFSHSSSELAPIPDYPRGQSDSFSAVLEWQAMPGVREKKMEHGPLLSSAVCTHSCSLELFACTGNRDHEKNTGQIRPRRENRNVLADSSVLYP